MTIDLSVQHGGLCSQCLSGKMLMYHAACCTGNLWSACDKVMPQQAIRLTSLTRETVQPPQPAPVRRDASAPCCLLSCMRWSSSSQLHSYRSLHACQPQCQAGTATREQLEVDSGR